MNMILDYTVGGYPTEVEMPERMRTFLEEIDSVCKRHGLSISHEDGHGAFLIEEYSKINIEWLFSASKCYRD